MRRPLFFVTAIAVSTVALFAFTSTKPATPKKFARTEKSRVDRGRYIIATAACNDCHTPGYIEKDGDVPESEWLKGNQLGFKGPWGTSYPLNLRLLISNFTEREWITFAKTTKGLPPMPWFNLHAMSDSDLGAVYAYVRTLQPLGEPAPSPLPPGEEPQGPYIDFSVHVPGQ